MVSLPEMQRSGFSRLWTIQFTAGPANVPNFEALGRADTPDWQRGPVTPIYVPDPDKYGEFQLAGKVQGERSLPTLSVIFRYPADKTSLLERFVRPNCDVDLQIHMGDCQDPGDFNRGWEKILVLPRATPTAWTTDPLGALGPAENVLINETVPFTGEDMYHIHRIIFAEDAAVEVVQEIVDIKICDKVTCGSCGIPSLGCDVVFALTLSAGGSPGLPAEVIFTQDGGTVWGDTNISTLAANEDPNEFACVGGNMVVISEDSESLHYAPLADILAGTEVWTEVSTGFVAAQGPLSIHSGSPRHTWIVGEGGYVYFSEDPTAGVVVQNAGVATAQDLNAVHGVDIEDVVAVGASNAVILTRNGGDTWAAVTGPNPGVVLNTVWMRTQDEWFVGDAGGQLWFTRDAGATWTEKTFPGSGAGVIRHIAFANPTVGYMAHDTAANAGRILRTIDGGNSWYVAPESNLVIPANDRINKVAPCVDNVNVVYGGGLADNATDGIIVKGA